ncbi:MAG: hypothetical protein AAGA58_19970 [Verrucomicrobiota bacterium]
MTPIRFPVLAILLLTLVSCGGEEAALAPGAFADESAKAGSSERADGQIGIQGEDPEWLFLFSELIHLGHGEFWSKDWTEVAAAATDPAPVIAAYKDALAGKGVELLIVPVPPKAAIYPEKFRASANESSVPDRAAYYAKLQEQGIDVLDLQALFLEKKAADPAQLLYCRQDSHPSAFGCQLIAEAIYEKVKDADWIAGEKAADGREFGTGEPETISFMGDLAEGFSVGEEKMEIIAAGEKTADGVTQVDPDNTTSPVIIVGDSHSLVFSIGSDMLAKSAGVTDHLQALLGFGVFQQSNKGSGIDSARMNLLRAAVKEKTLWEGKKLLVWIFGEREFTQATKWREIPLEAP